MSLATLNTINFETLRLGFRFITLISNKRLLYWLTWAKAEVQMKMDNKQLTLNLNYTYSKKMKTSQALIDQSMEWNYHGNHVEQSAYSGRIARLI